MINEAIKGNKSENPLQKKADKTLITIYFGFNSASFKYSLINL